MMLTVRKVFYATEITRYTYEANLEMDAATFIKIESGQDQDYENIQEWIDEQDDEIDWKQDAWVDSKYIECVDETADLEQGYDIYEEYKDELKLVAFLTGNKDLVKLCDKQVLFLNSQDIQEVLQATIGELA